MTTIVVSRGACFWLIISGVHDMCNLGNESNYAEAVVSTAHPVALEAAKKILLKGGSDIDDAIAEDAVLGVVELMVSRIIGAVVTMINEPECIRILTNLHDRRA